MKQASRSFVFFSRSSREKADLMRALVDGYDLMLLLMMSLMMIIKMMLLMIMLTGVPTWKIRRNA